MTCWAVGCATLRAALDLDDDDNSYGKADGASEVDAE